MSTKYQSGLVSIVMPAYNAEAFVGRSIGSILEQSYGNWELLVIDDCSTDATADKLAVLSQQDDRIKFQKNTQNLGAAGTRNKALNAASGQYVAFLDADDQWERDKLSVQVAFMQEHEAAFTFTGYRVVAEDGNSLGRLIDMNSPDAVDYGDMLKKTATIGCSTVMIDQSKVGPLQMPLIKTKEDYALWLDVLRRGVRARRVNSVLTSYQITSNSLSRNKLQEARRQWYVYRKIEDIGVIGSSWFLMNYAWRAVFGR